MLSIKDSFGKVHLFPRDKVTVCPPAIAEGANPEPNIELEPNTTRTVIRGRVMPTPACD